MIYNNTFLISEAISWNRGECAVNTKTGSMSQLAEAVKKDCMNLLADLESKHGKLTWYSGYSDEDYEAGEYIGRENFIYD